MYSFTEENYLKAIYKLSLEHRESISTNAIAELLNTRAASVTDMLKKLAVKKLILYVKYQGVQLTDKGHKVALNTVRKHRLWEFFLFDKLKFGWHEVHDVAEQLEHINSDLLMDKLEAFLDYPTVDPHGDPIPRKDGSIRNPKLKPLSDCVAGRELVMSGVKEHSPVFLQHLDKIGLTLGKRIRVAEVQEFDGSMHLVLNKQTNLQVSREVARNILVAEA